MMTLLILISTVGLASQARPIEVVHSLEIIDETGEFSLPPEPQIEARWLSPRTPSCLAFHFRKREMMRREAEIDSLLEKLDRQRGLWSEEDQREFDELIRRQAEVQREIHGHRLEVRVQYDLSPKDGRLPAWVLERSYKLDVRVPGLTWYGLDAAEPEGVHIDLSDQAITISYSLSLSQVCSAPPIYQVTLKRT